MSVVRSIGGICCRLRPWIKIISLEGSLHCAHKVYLLDIYAPEMMSESHEVEIALIEASVMILSLASVPFIFL